MMIAAAVGPVAAHCPRSTRQLLSPRVAEWGTGGDQHGQTKRPAVAAGRPCKLMIVLAFSG
jgi:hypothetical protein